MGCYPLFGCTNWSRLHEDLEELESELVSLAVVTDPFGQYDRPYLERCFRDVVFPFKQHHIIDLSYPIESFVTQHHRRNAKRALELLVIEKCERADDYLDDWVNLYDSLKAKHNINGITAFSRSSFEKQLKIPGMTAFRAVDKGDTIGMLLWYVQGDVGYYHLGAYSSKGYQLNASFALFWTAIRHFASLGLPRLSIGAGAGTVGDSNDGLTRFKKGWSNEIKTAYFCGRIFDPQKYKEIQQVKGNPPTNFFPAYRLGEF
jgi:hypothetical protein